ncbi:MAG: T9SS type A sorting domain-containing protein [Flavobacteriales bacterium]|nr:T9SS type A sorting domain-containing protein [Flavobacteriales bacterium]
MLRYVNADWDTLPGVVPGRILSILQHHDTLFIGGDFEELNGQPSSRVAYHDGTAWRSYGSVIGSAVARLCSVEDTMYAVGAIDFADGVPAQGVAKRIGSSWVPIGDIDDPDNTVGNIVKYNDRLVISSNASIGTARCVFELVDGEWQPLGQGILGGLSGVGSLEVYGNDLYIGGQFTTNTGNAGMNIMRWDGTAYHSMGSGIQVNLNNTSTLCSVKMLVHEGLLWVRHFCNYAGGVSSKGLATWDGTEWCGVPGDLVSDPGSLSDMAFYKDTLFMVKFGDTLDGVFVNGVAKFIGESYVGECSGPVAVAEVVAAPLEPAIAAVGVDQWVMTELSNGRYEMTLFDQMGRMMFRKALVSNAGRSDIFSTQHLRSGLYFVQITGHSGFVGKVLVSR